MSEIDDVVLRSIATCPDCGNILGEHTRVEHDRSKRECFHCRRIYPSHEVFAHV